jgi:uncharacterized protein
VRSRVGPLLWAAGWPARGLLLLLVRGYRVTLGKVIGGNCRFHPSCSAYAELAIGQLGAARGAALTAWRVLRCTPLSRGGVDYPPPRSPSQYEGAIHPVAVSGGPSAAGKVG